MPETKAQSSTADAPPLADHVVRNVHAVTEMHVEAERSLGKHQRAIETATELLGRPIAVYLIASVVVLWVAANSVAHWLHRTPLDLPPFQWLQGVIGLAALLTSTMVLVTQNRQSKLFERRMHLDLQVNLLTEQKTAKLIELIEELRRDLPNVQNRHDPEAEALKQSAEPHLVMAALDERAGEIEGRKAATTEGL